MSEPEPDSDLRDRILGVLDIRDFDLRHRTIAQTAIGHDLDALAWRYGLRRGEPETRLMVCPKCLQPMDLESGEDERGTNELHPYLQYVCPNGHVVGDWEDGFLWPEDEHTTSCADPEK